MTHRSGKKDEGFSLVEAVIALMIFGAVASAAAVVVSSSDRRAARDLVRVRAGIAAEALLARMGLDIARQDGPVTGALEDGGRYRLTFEDYVEDGDAALRSGLVKVTAEVTPAHAASRPVSLSTLRPVAGDPWRGRP